VWWAWVGYAWLTNLVDPDLVRNRLIVFAAMAAMLVVALAVPQAFGADAWLFAIAYAAVRGTHILLLSAGVRGTDNAQAVRRLAVTATLGPILILLAAPSDGAMQYVLWGVALLVDYSGPLFPGERGWTVHAAHFAERHGLIVIIALGESLVALGLGANELEVDALLALGAVLGIVVIAALWWAYFDVVALVAERRLHEAQGAARGRMARDSYSYLHLPMIAGVVFLALGLKKVLGHVDEPLKVAMSAALLGGVALYLLAHVGFRLRNTGTWSVQRVLLALLCLAAIVPATEVDALWTLAALAVLLAALVTYEAVRFREARARVRAGGH
jgi:low temperature requirement protein LtrA